MSAVFNNQKVVQSLQNPVECFITALEETKHAEATALAPGSEDQKTKATAIAKEKAEVLEQQTLWLEKLAAENPKALGSKVEQIAELPFPIQCTNDIKLNARLNCIVAQVEISNPGTVSSTWAKDIDAGLKKQNHLCQLIASEIGKRFGEDALKNLLSGAENRNPANDVPRSEIISHRPTPAKKTPAKETSAKVDNQKDINSIENVESLKNPVKRFIKAFEEKKQADDNASGKEKTEILQRHVLWLEKLARTYPEALGSEVEQLADIPSSIGSMNDMKLNIRLNGIVAQVKKSNPDLVSEKWLQDIEAGVKRGSYLYERIAAEVGKHFGEDTPESLLSAVANNISANNGPEKWKQEKRAETYETINDLLCFTRRNFLSGNQLQILIMDKMFNPELNELTEKAASKIGNYINDAREQERREKAARDFLNKTTEKQKGSRFLPRLNFP